MSTLSQTIMTSIEQLVDERINFKLREMQKEKDGTDPSQIIMASTKQLVNTHINQESRNMQKDMPDNDTTVNSNNDTEYLSIGDLSKLTGLQKATIYAKRSRRELPAYKFGRALRFKRSEVDAWIRSKQLTCIPPITTI